jgi:uncharacterized membrane protein
LLAVSMKEDMALMLAVIGLVVALRGARQIGFGIAAVSLAWFVLATRVIIPWRNGVGPFYEQLFGELGDSPTEVAWNVVRHPGEAFSVATEPDRLEYYRMMFFPVALVPLLAPEALVIGLPMLAVNVFTGAGFPFPRDYRFHYSALVLVAVMVATVEAVAKIRSPRGRQVVVGVLLATSLASTVAWGAAPISRDYDSGIWPLQSDPRVAAKEAALRMLPDDASVSAAYNIVPHIAHRERVYEFPVPWQPVNWGVDGENLHDPADVEWLLVDRTLLEPGGDDAQLLDSLLGREFDVRYERDDIVLAERDHDEPAEGTEPEP